MIRDIKEKSSNWSTDKGINAVKKEQNSWVVYQVFERVKFYDNFVKKFWAKLIKKSAR